VYPRPPPFDGYRPDPSTRGEKRRVGELRASLAGTGPLLEGARVRAERAAGELGATGRTCDAEEPSATGKR